MGVFFLVIAWDDVYCTHTWERYGIENDEVVAPCGKVVSERERASGVGMRVDVWLVGGLEDCYGLVLVILGLFG